MRIPKDATDEQRAAYAAIQEAKKIRHTADGGGQRSAAYHFDQDRALVNNRKASTMRRALRDKSKAQKFDEDPEDTPSKLSHTMGYSNVIVSHDDGGIKREYTR
jgi:hypothetical protein